MKKITPEKLAKYTATSSEGNTLTLDVLEKIYLEAIKVPQPVGIEFRWKLVFRKSFPFIRLMKVGKWIYKGK